MLFQRQELFHGFVADCSKMSMKESKKYQDIFLWVTKWHRTHVLGTAQFRSMNIKIRDVDSHHKKHRTVKEYLHGDICSNAIAEFSYSDFCRKWDHQYFTFILAVSRIMNRVVIITLNGNTPIFMTLVSP